MVDQGFANRVATAAYHGEHTFRQSAVLHRLADGSGLNFRGARVGVVGLDDDCCARGQCRSGVAPGHRVADGEVARAKNRHRADGDFLQSMVHARAGLAIRLRRVDGHLQEAPFAHDIGELAELGGGSCDFTLQLRLGQTGLQRCPCRELFAGGIEMVGDAFEERRALGERGMAVGVKGLVGEGRGPVDLLDAAQGEIRLDELVGRGVQRLHGPFGGRDFMGADQQISGQFHFVHLTAPAWR